jgi:hypothetical protein
MANCTYSLGRVARDQYQHDEAIGSLKDALRIYEEVGDRTGMANCMCSLDCCKFKLREPQA